MIIIKLQGGLGNQMFQYAFGKALSLKYSCRLKVDVGFLKANANDEDGFTAREYELDIFDTHIKTASSKLVRGFEKENNFKKILHRFKMPYKKVYHESKLSTQEQIAQIRPPVLLIGYWQSESFFIKYSDRIRKEFVFKNAAGKVDALLKAKIDQVHSVSVHIRRGDYVTNPVANDVLGILDMKYYADAMELMNSKVDNAFYLFFSDDPDWVRSQFGHLPNSVVVDQNGAENNDADMYLMSLCRHNIIANSSFSWWGAWLNDHINKIVIAPKLWNKNVQFSNNGLIPAEWYLI